MHFVGRDREYALLAQRLKETMERFGGAVTVEGEAGAGKTRLVEEFLGYARSRGARVLSGRCYERELGPPLEPIMDALDPVTDMDRIVSEFRQSGAEERDYLWEAVPYDNTRIYRVLVRELIRKSQGTGNKALVLFVDDVQWADPATLDFLSYSAKRVSSEQVLLVAAYRREDAARLSGWLDHLAERRAVTTLSLSRLSLEDTAEFLNRMSSRTFGELSSLADFLQEESEGNPFYTVEYLRWLIEAGAVEIDSRRRICALNSELLQDSALPSGVRTLVQARISSMDDEARDLLKLAAVMGRTFGLELLCKATARGEAETLDIIEPLTSSGLVVEAPAEEEYYFSHDKLRQAFYEGISGPRRRRLHLRVAEVLEEVGGESAELAHHYLRAHAWRPALENLARAAQKAEKSCVWDSALEGYARALEVAKRLPDSKQTRFELLAARESLLERRMGGGQSELRRFRRCSTWRTSWETDPSSRRPTSGTRVYLRSFPTWRGQRRPDR
jgi:predicted ATPase